MRILKSYLLPLIAFISCLVFFVSCSNKKSITDPIEPPKILITSNNLEIPYVIGKNIWNGSLYDRLDNLQFIMQENTPEDLIYLPQGEKIHIEFKQSPPDAIELIDEVIDNSGNVIFNESSLSRSIELTNGQCTFILDNHTATLMSSNTDNFKDGVLRGFRLICKWSENECEYSFVIKTDE